MDLFLVMNGLLWPFG